MPPATWFLLPGATSGSYTAEQRLLRKPLFVEIDPVEEPVIVPVNEPFVKEVIQPVAVPINEPVAVPIAEQPVTLPIENVNETQIDEEFVLTSPINGPLQCAETKLPKNKKGEDIGSKLHFSNGREYFEVEVRYMATKKNIRIKFITDTEETSRYIIINDNVIPPINQISRIIERIKNDYMAIEVEQPPVFDIAEEFIFPDDTL